MAETLCPIETFKIEYTENFNNLPLLEILDIKNFLSVDNLPEVSGNLSLRQGKTKNSTLLQDFNENYWAVFSTSKTLLRDRKTLSDPLIYYLLADIYKLVLGNAAPNLQFIKSPTELLIGSEFIKNYESMISTNKICYGSLLDDFPNCKEANFSNYYTFISLAMILGESDANARNFGIITPISNNVILAKIDHDLNIGIYSNLTFQERVLKTLKGGNYRLHKAIKDNLNCLAEAIGNLGHIPDDLWQESIYRRLNKLFEVYELFNDPVIGADLIFLKNLAEFLITIKSKLPTYRYTLELEYLILQDRVETFKSFISENNIDIRAEFEFMGLRDSTLLELEKSGLSYTDSFIKAAPNLCTISEYALSREKFNIVEFLEKATLQDTKYICANGICATNHDQGE
ncbi:hypothetical protein NOVO_07070 [Rickettsiales bacterium Ac37b]|nr:hypothetical protein NOVO_07070 [Rickettsiales bacterium Ac37b]